VWLSRRSGLGLTLDNADREFNLEPPRPFLVTGVRLSQATQSTLYKGILEQKAPSARAASTLNLGITKACIEELTTKSPTDQKIWTSLRSKDFPPRIRVFLWKTMHNAYKCGRYWSHIPSFEQRGICHACENVEESMEHILTECKASGQDIIWKLAEELWALRGLPWTRPRLGTILGCGLGDFRAEHDKNERLVGANRLYAILLSESAHQIWRARCKWRISDEASLEKIPTEQEIRANWLKNLNRRLQLEMLMTDKYRYGSRALEPKLVEKTWWGVLRDQESLQEDWLKMGTGVLVGIG
jgi:ribonuclease HI